MSTIAFILGKYNRREFSSEDISPSTEMWEGDRKIFPKTHYHNDPTQFSNHTERDEIQAVGKLYKGKIEDE